jgi:glycosaminoglycan xylosylkinase
MCQVLTAINEVPIVSAKNSFRKGTQLKLNFTVEGNKTLIFKPSWYARSFVIDGEVYSGKDRHNSEIFAFYLGAVLNLRWTSIVIGKSINLRDVFNMADKELQETIISKSEHNKHIISLLLNNFV